MQDVAVSYRRFSFLGPEFLTWIWYVTENDPQTVNEALGEAAFLVVGNRIVLEKKRAEDTERVTIRGETAQMDEGLLALAKGAVVTEVALTLEIGDLKWSFAVKGENLAVSSLKTPPTGPVQVTDEIEGAVLEKISLYERPVEALQALFLQFIRLRIGETWTTIHVPNMKKWVQEAATPPAKTASE